MLAIDRDAGPRDAGAGAEVVLEICYGDNAPQSLVDFFTNAQMVK